MQNPVPVSEKPLADKGGTSGGSAGGSLVLTYLLLTLGMLFFGISFIASKYALMIFQPVSIILFRAIIASGLLVLTARHRGVRLKLERREVPLFLLLALFQPFAYFLGETYGLKLVSASTASIIIATIPLFTPFASAPLLGEKLSLKAVLGLALSFAGVWFIVTAGSMDSAPGSDLSLPGLMLMLVAVLAAVGYSVVVKTIDLHRSPLVIVTWQHIFGVVMLIPVFLITDLRGLISPDHPVKQAGAEVLFPAMGSLIFLALFASTLAFLFYSNGIRKLGAGRANVFTNTVPIFTAITAFLLLGEQFPPEKLLGMALVIGGVSISQGRSPVLR